MDYNPQIVAAFILVILMFAGILGTQLRKRLPREHLEGETKEMAKVAIGFVTTLSALVLGLMLGSAKTSFDAHSVEVQTAAAKVALLDYNLRELGIPAEPARALLRQFVAGRMLAIWGGDGQKVVTAGGRSGFGDLKRAVELINPPGELEHAVWRKALDLVDDLAQLRALSLTREGSQVMRPLLILLVFWLSVIAMGLNLFAPRNLTVSILNVVCAISGTGAIYLILEMNQPFSGPIRVSAAPLRAALVQLSQ